MYSGLCCGSGGEGNYTKQPRGLRDVLFFPRSSQSSLLQTFRSVLSAPSIFPLPLPLCFSLLPHSLSLSLYYLLSLSHISYSGENFFSAASVTLYFCWKQTKGTNEGNQPLHSFKFKLLYFLESLETFFAVKTSKYVLCHRSRLRHIHEGLYLNLPHRKKINIEDCQKSAITQAKG